MAVTLKTWSLQEVLTKTDLDSNESAIANEEARLESVVTSASMGNVVTVTGDYTATTANHRDFFILNNATGNKLYLPIPSTYMYCHVMNITTAARAVTCTGGSIRGNGSNTSEISLSPNSAALFIYPGTGTTWYCFV